MISVLHASHQSSDYLSIAVSISKQKTHIKFFLKKERNYMDYVCFLFFFNRTGLAQAYTLTYFCHLPDSAEVNMSFSVHWNILF